MMSSYWSGLLSLLGIASYGDGAAAAAAAAAEASSISYDLVEQGETQHGSKFQRFVAVDVASGEPLTTLDWTNALQEGRVDSLNFVLSKAPFKAFYFEVKPVTQASASSKQRPFEFVLVDARTLTRRKPRFQSFEEPCEKSSTSGDPSMHNSYGCVFPNLSGDATLIVPQPKPEVSSDRYTHLAKFIRGAPPSQVMALWKLVAEAYSQSHEPSLDNPMANNNNTNVWLSTAGNGVPWLHFRLDSAPKYYRYGPYKEAIVNNAFNVPETPNKSEDLESGEEMEPWSYL